MTQRVGMIGGRVGLSLAAVASFVMVLSGCAVPQRPGGGKEFHLQEPQTKAWYWLYLPKGYSENSTGGNPWHKKHPLVMTFHGMRPFDNAHSQCREWQQEADRYGFVICAPELRTPYWLSPLPLNSVTGSLKRDERAILAVMDEVERTADVDPNAVLITSWSYGGYVGHYMLNHHPERFTCLGVKQSNFSADILEPKNVPRYRDYRIAVFYTENDFAICQRESQEAAIWYSRLGFELTFAEFSDKGHERTPSLAAAFFARACGAEAKTPPVELASLRVKELPVLDRTDGKVAGVESVTVDRRPDRKVVLPPVSKAGSETTRETVIASAGGLNEGLPVAASASYEPAVARPKRFAQSKPIEPTNPLRTRPLTPKTTGPNAPRRIPERTPKPKANDPVRVRLSSTIGIAPLMVSYSVALPDRIRRKAYFLWTDNGEPVSNGVNGQLFLTTPGEHQIEVLVTTDEGQEYRARRTVTVLERISARLGSRR